VEQGGVFREYITVSNGSIHKKKYKETLKKKGRESRLPWKKKVA